MASHSTPVASAAIIAAFPACPAASAADAPLFVAPELVGELTMLLTAVLGAMSDVTFVSNSLLLVHASCRCRLTASLPACTSCVTVLCMIAMITDTLQDTHLVLHDILRL